MKRFIESAQRSAILWLLVVGSAGSLWAQKPLKPRTLKVLTWLAELYSDPAFRRQ
jgi:hypothetical protein